MSSPTNADAGPGGDAPSPVAKLLAGPPSDARRTAEALLPLVYDELRKLAAAKMRRERTDHTLEATGLVHEAFMRLVGSRKDAFANRAHFFHAAAEAMRRILIEHARAREGPVRGGGMLKLPIDVVELAANADSEQIMALDEAIARLAEQDAEAAHVVRLRFYAGMSIDEVAEALDRSPRTIKRDWTFARAFLLRQLELP
jgi:RNA polymerase sigma factor (TIGR02999 family)